MVSVRRPLPQAPADLWDRPDMSEALARRDIGAVFKIFRQWTGATQTQIAAACEVPQSHVSEIQNGRRQVTSLEIFERIADGIGIPRARIGLADKPGSVPEPRSGPAGGPAAEVPAEMVRVYPSRTAVPGDLWRALFAEATHQVDVLVIAGLFLPDGHADFTTILRRKAASGVKIRYALGNPESPAIALRGDEEGIGDGLAARTRITLTYLAPLRDAPGIDLRLHSTTLYNSIYRFDGDMLVNTHVYGAPAAHSPVLHLREQPGGLFDHYAASFERVWATTEGA